MPVNKSYLKWFLITATVCALVYFYLLGGKNDVDLELKINREEFQNGDKIEISLLFHAQGITRLYINDNVSETISIRIYPEDKESDINKKYFNDRTLLDTDTRKKRRNNTYVKLRRGETHIVRITGQILVNDNKEEITFHFNELGSITKSSKHQGFLIGAFFLPTYYGSFDSLEYYSNRVLINVSN